jgi:hypothetical protein
MLKRLYAWIKARRSRSLTPEEVEAQREAERIEDDLETTRVAERQADSRLLGR